MKAKVKSTDEIIEVLNGVGTKEGKYIDGTGTTYTIGELDFNVPQLTEQDTTPCDLWEQRRFELAKDLLPSFAIAVNAYNTATGGAVINFLLSKEEAAQKAVEYADALINELKKQSNDKG